MANLRCLAAGALLLLAAGPAPAQKDDKASVPTVTYEQLGKMVRDRKGKVVAVYFWADY
jgi:hypothetical protein